MLCFDKTTTGHGGSGGASEAAFEKELDFGETTLLFLKCQHAQPL